MPLDAFAILVPRARSLSTASGPLVDWQVSDDEAKNAAIRREKSVGRMYAADTQDADVVIVEVCVGDEIWRGHYLVSPASDLRPERHKYASRYQRQIDQSVCHNTYPTL
jgi:hypothetical protein